MSLSLYKRSGQSTPLSTAQVDSNWEQIETTINNLVIGVGSVTSFSAGSLSPLFTTTVTNPGSTPALSFTAPSVSQGAVYMGPVSGSGVASFRALQASDLPTIPTSKGGTGLTTVGLPYQILRTNVSGTGFEYASLNSNSSRLTILTTSPNQFRFDVSEANLNLNNIGSSALLISKGGTGATTQQVAINNLTAATVADTGKYLKIDGSGNAVWDTIPTSAVASINGLTGTPSIVATSNGLSVTAVGSSITVSLASADGSNAGALTASAQTIGGVKTFASMPVMSAAIANAVLFTDASKNVSSSSNLTFNSTSGELVVKNISPNSISGIKTTNYTILSTDYVVLCDTLVSNITLTLPSTSSLTLGKEYIIKDYYGNAGSKNIKIMTTGADKIDTVSEINISTNHGSYSVKYVYTNGWIVIAKN